MSSTRVVSYAAVLALALAAGALPGQAAEPIRVGDINSYSVIPLYTGPYRNGWRMAVDEVNASGGVLGRKLEVVSYDDAAKPGEAVNRAQQLVSKDHVALISGTYLSNVGLAVSSFAKQNRVFFMAGEPLSDAITWEQGNRYTFRLRPNTYMQAAMLAREAAGLAARRWATVAPNYEYGQSAVRNFQKLLAVKRPGLKWVAEQWPQLGKIDAGATVEALAEGKPEAIYSALFASDLAKFVREGETRGLFARRAVLSLLTGEPEYLEPLKDEAPRGWIVTGYPWYAIKTPEHARFLKAYMAKFHEHPYMGSVVGYSTMMAVAATIRRAGSLDTDKLIKAAQGLRLTTPFGKVVFRAIDHQSTMGAYVGRIAVQDGKGVMADWHYADGADYLPSDAEVRKMRPAD